MFHDIMLKLITLCHILLIIMITAIPFTDSNYFLMLHAVFVPFIMVHWICGDNTCVLSLVERQVRKRAFNDENPENCYTCQLIEPVYDFRKKYDCIANAAYTVFIGLWIMSMCNLFNRYRTGIITSYTDLFII